MRARKWGFTIDKVELVKASYVFFFFFDSHFLIFIHRTGSKGTALCLHKHLTLSGSLGCGGVILQAKPDALSLGSRIHIVPSHTTQPSYSDMQQICIFLLHLFHFLTVTWKKGRPQLSYRKVSELKEESHSSVFFCFFFTLLYSGPWTTELFVAPCQQACP
ncbi:hypothetical protein ILYODFUR_037323 [Ilyodon furcidens]|uniref:Uncharacterized protein n=1 Tax=Ilyodon furcidens TaxID=33524 RepID=A0ABV0UEB6_9TELE